MSQEVLPLTSGGYSDKRAQSVQYVLFMVGCSQARVKYVTVRGFRTFPWAVV